MVAVNDTPPSASGEIDESKGSLFDRLLVTSKQIGRSSRLLNRSRVTGPARHYVCYACGWVRSVYWFGGGSLISVTPSPSLTMTNHDAAYWPEQGSKGSTPDCHIR